MKVLILFKLEGNLKGIILLNLICINLKSYLSSVDIDLIIQSEKKIENIFFTKDNYRKIIYHSGYKDLWRMQNENNYDGIINLSKNPGYRIFQFLIKSPKKWSINRLQFNNSNILQTIEKEAKLAEKLTRKIAGNNFKIRTVPELGIKKIKLNNTTKVIDWILESSNLKRLSSLRYVFVYLNQINENCELGKIKKLICSLTSDRRFKIILIINGNNSFENNLIEEYQESKSVIMNFISNKDFHYFIKLSESAKLIVSNDAYLNLACKINEWNCLFLENNTLTNEPFEVINERVILYQKSVI